MIVQKPKAEKQLGKKLSGRKTDWFLLSSMGTRKLGGPYRARSDAEARERAVQFFKHQANPKKNPMRKIAEMHPDDRAIVGSAIGSAAGYMIAPPMAPLGAAAGHIAGKRLGRQPKRNPGKGKQVFNAGDILITPSGELVIVTGQTKKRGSRVKYQVAVNRGDYSPSAARSGIGTQRRWSAIHPSWEAEALLHKKFEEDPKEIYEPAWAAVANDLWGHENTPVNVITDGTIAPRYKTRNVTIKSKKKQNPFFGRGKKPPQKKKEPKKKPPKRKRHRSLRNIALDIKKNWKDLRHAGPESRRLLRIRGIVDTMQTLCHPSDIVEEGPDRGKSGSVLIGNFLATVGGSWRGDDATRLKDELRALVAEQYWHDEPIENPQGSAGLRPGRPGSAKRYPKVGDNIGDWEIVEQERELVYLLRRRVYGHTWHLEVWFMPTRGADFYALYQGDPNDDGLVIDEYERRPAKFALSSGYMSPDGWQRLMRDAIDFGNKKTRKWVASQPPKRMLNPEKNPRPFASRTHDWKEVLIQKDGKRATRKQILDYYWKNRKKIWPFLEGQTVLVVMAPKKNEFVLIRKRGSDEKYIKLTKLDGIDDENSFEYWINRRVVEFHPVLTGKKTPILWLDIDIHAKTKVKKTALRAKAKKAFPKLRKIMRQFGVTKIYAYDSGIAGYHLEGPLKAPKGVDKLRKDFTAALKAAFADDPIFTTGIAQSGQIRLDTTTMHTLGSLRAPYSFTVAGGTKKQI